MSGITGIITKLPGAHAREQLRSMVHALHWDRVCATGTWFDEPSGVYVGWVSGKGSPPEPTPLFNERGDVCLVFSGEDFPEPKTVDGLRQRGRSLPTNGPSHLIHLGEGDPSFPRSLNGQFHGLLTDRRSGTSVLFNDRYGMRPVYYHESPGAFYFASEAKAMLAVLPELRKADLRSLGEFVGCGCVLEDRTLFQGIRTLPSGSAWRFRAGTVERKEKYFLPREWEDQGPLAAEAFYRELSAILARNLPRYFTGGRRVGMALTGGLDTRVIMAWHKSPPGSLPCYTFGGMFRDCQDAQVARRIAKLVRQPHRIITVGREFLDRFPHYAERSVYLTEGGVDVSRSCDLYLSERAREIAPVKVVGTYGSEIMRESVMFKPWMPPPGLFCGEFLPYIQRAEATYGQIRCQHPVTFAAFCQSPWYHRGVLALEQSQLTVRSPYLDNDFVRAAYRAPTSSPLDVDVRLRLICDADPILARIPSDRGVVPKPGWLPSKFARSLLDFTAKAEYGYDYGMPQWAARIDQFFFPFHIERLFLGRHKFSHFRVWYRGALAKYVRELLLDRKTVSRAYFRPHGLEAIVNGHLKGGRNHTVAIHRALTLELLHRLFLDPA